MENGARRRHRRAYSNVRGAHISSSHNGSVCIRIDGEQRVKEQPMCADRTKGYPQARDRDQVAALANGLRAIEAFATSRQRMTVADVAKQSRLTRAATRRYLLTLV